MKSDIHSTTYETSKNANYGGNGKKEYIKHQHEEANCKIRIRDIMEQGVANNSHGLFLHSHEQFYIF